MGRWSWILGIAVALVASHCGPSQSPGKRDAKKKKNAKARDSEVEVIEREDDSETEEEETDGGDDEQDDELGGKKGKDDAKKTEADELARESCETTDVNLVRVGEPKHEWKWSWSEGKVATFEQRAPLPHHQQFPEMNAPFRSEATRLSAKEAKALRADDAFWKTAGCAVTPVRYFIRFNGGSGSELANDARFDKPLPVLIGTKLSPRRLAALLKKPLKTKVKASFTCNKIGTTTCVAAAPPTRDIEIELSAKKEEGGKVLVSLAASTKVDGEVKPFIGGYEGFLGLSQVLVDEETGKLEKVSYTHERAANLPPFPAGEFEVK